MAATSKDIDNKLQADRKKETDVLLFSNKKINLFKMEPKVVLSKSDNNGLFVNIETQYLLIRTVQNDDLNDCIQLYGDQKVMCKFGTGQIIDKRTVAERMMVWIDRLNNGNCFNPLSIFKKDSNKFVGQIFLTAQEKSGEAELGFLFLEPYWGQGIATEVCEAIVFNYAPLLKERGYKIGDKPFELIVATAKKDNLASNAILRKLGFMYMGDIEKFGATRSYYRKDLNTHKLRSKL